MYLFLLRTEADSSFLLPVLLHQARSNFYDVSFLNRRTIPLNIFYNDSNILISASYQTRLNAELHEEFFIHTRTQPQIVCVRNCSSESTHHCSDNESVYGFMGSLREAERAEEEIYFSSVTERWRWVTSLPKHPKSSSTECSPEDLLLCISIPHAVTRARVLVKQEKPLPQNVTTAL